MPKPASSASGWKIATPATSCCGHRRLRSKRRAEKRSAFRRSPRHTPLRAGLSPQSGSGWNVLFYGQLARLSLRPVGDANSGTAGRCSAVRRHAPFRIDTWVVLPDHMHCLWTLPPGDGDFPGRWRAIKTALAKALPARESRSPAGRGERGIWQRRYWEHTIRDDRDFAAHLDYTHFNPVKHGLVKHPADWPHSSFRQCVAKGLYPAGWIGGNEEPFETGERR